MNLERIKQRIKDSIKKDQNLVDELIAQNNWSETHICLVMCKERIIALQKLLISLK